MPFIHPPIPTYQTAIVAQAPGHLIVRNDVPLPPLPPSSLLIKTVAVAINPSDAKMVDYSCTVGAISGYDYAGTIAQLGPDLSADHQARFHVGDRVCGSVHGMNALAPENGAFAEYLRADPNLTLKIPEHMSFEDAATLGTGLATTGLAMYKSLGIPHRPDRPAETPYPVLVYGGSTATGTMAIQLLKLSNLSPITTCSPSNNALVRSAGATATFDYHDPACASAIRTHTSNALAYALDCITTDSSPEICYGALGRAGGHYTALEPVPERFLQLRKAVTADWVLALSLYGKKVELDGVFGRDESKEDYQFGREWFGVVQGVLDRGELRAHPVEVGKGGFKGVVEGIERVRGGGVSGKKLVFRTG